MLDIWRGQHWIIKIAFVIMFLMVISSCVALIYALAFREYPIPEYVPKGIMFFVKNTIFDVSIIPKIEF